MQVVMRFLKQVLMDSVEFSNNVKLIFEVFLILRVLSFFKWLPI